MPVAVMGHDIVCCIMVRFLRMYQEYTVSSVTASSVTATVRYVGSARKSALRPLSFWKLAFFRGVVIA